LNRWQSNLVCNEIQTLPCGAVAINRDVQFGGDADPTPGHGRNVRA